MNFPSTTEGNWLWRLDRRLINGKLEKRIQKMVRHFGRY
jgi:4-alpha-glucanotransferase